MSAGGAPGREPASASRDERRVAVDWLRAAVRGWLLDEEAVPAAPAVAELGQMAWCHNLEPLLYKLVAEGRLASPSPELARRWQGAYFETLASGSSLLELVRALLDGCQQQDVPMVVLKGLVTAARAYGDPALRPMSDVDLLCRQADLGAVCRAAAGFGFEAGGEDSIYHLKLVHPGRSTLIELHFDLYDLIAERREFARRGLEAPAEATLDGIPLPALPLEMDAVFQLAHLVNHDLAVNLRAWLDLAALLHRQRTALDPARLARELAAADLEPEFGRLVRLLEELFEIELPAELPRSEPGALLAGVERCLIEPEQAARQPALAEAAARPWRSRAGYLRRLLFPARARLRALDELPPSSRPTASRLGHLAATLRRGWGKLARRGEAGPAAQGPSIKREVLRRR